MGAEKRETLVAPVVFAGDDKTYTTDSSSIPASPEAPATGLSSGGPHGEKVEAAAAPSSASSATDVAIPAKPEEKPNEAPKRSPVKTALLVFSICVSTLNSGYVLSPKLTDVSQMAVFLAALDTVGFLVLTAFVTLFSIVAHCYSVRRKPLTLF